MNLVTGGTGLVGSRLMFDLLKRGERVRALRREASDLDFTARVFAFYDPGEGRKLFNAVEWVTGDLLDVSALGEAMQGIKRVYHAAALVSYHPADAKKLLEVNATGTENVVNAALAAGVECLAYISSVAALGRPANGGAATEDDQWTREGNTSQYGLSKYMAEREVWRGTAEGLDAVIVNPGIVLGPSRADQSSGMLLDMLRGGNYFYPSGTTGYVDVRDVSRAVLAVMDAQKVNRRYVLVAENLAFRDLLIQSAEVFDGKVPRWRLSYAVLSVVQRLLKVREWLGGPKARVTAETTRSAYRHNLYSSDRIRRELGFRFTSIYDTLVNCRAFFDSQP